MLITIGCLHQERDMTVIDFTLSPNLFISKIRIRQFTHTSLFLSYGFFYLHLFSLEFLIVSCYYLFNLTYEKCYFLTLMWIYWSWLVVVAKMPGYKSKSTSILLAEEAMTVDFILDPVITPMGSLLGSGCDFSRDNKSRLQLVEYFPQLHLEISLTLVVVILVFLCFLLRRRAILNYLKHRESVGPKRSNVAVWLVLYEHLTKDNYKNFTQRVHTFIACFLAIRILLFALVEDRVRLQQPACI